jgi:hypothetical protein
VRFIAVDYSSLDSRNAIILFSAHRRAPAKEMARSSSAPQLLR